MHIPLSLCQGYGIRLRLGLSLELGLGLGFMSPLTYTRRHYSALLLGVEINLDNQIGYTVMSTLGQSASIAQVLVGVICST